MFCPSCGAENADNTAFCAKCGTKIDPAAPNPPAAPAAKPPAPPRTTVDRLPNAAEGIVKPVVLGALALLAFQFAAFAFGGPNRMTLGTLFGLLVMPADLFLFTALWSGLRRIESPAAKPASQYAAALATLVPATALQIGLSLIVASAGDKAEAAASALLLPGIVSGIAGLAAFVSFILLVVAVRKAHDGQLRTFSTVFLVYSLVSMVVAPVLVFAPAVGGCAAVLLHGWLLLSLEKILSAPAPEGEEGFGLKKTPKKLVLGWALVLALCLGGLCLLPSDVPAVGGDNPLCSFSRGINTTIAVNNGREIVQAILQTNNDRLAESLSEIWPRYGKGMTNADDYFRPLFQKGLLANVKAEQTKGWSVFVPEIRSGDSPFLVSSNVKDANRAGRTAVSLIDGYLAVDTSDAIFGKEIVVITRRGAVLEGKGAVLCLIGGMTGPWELLPAE